MAIQACSHESRTSIGPGSFGPQSAAASAAVPSSAARTVPAPAMILMPRFIANPFLPVDLLRHCDPEPDPELQ